MKISISWLRDYLCSDKTAVEIAEILTNAGLEVAAIESTGISIEKVVAAQILESVQHPNAERLSVCKVDDGSGTPRQIVCGAKNFRVGDKVPLALPGAILPGNFKIKIGKLRGIESEGMMCSSNELGLGQGADGLLILGSETRAGTPLAELFPAEEIFEIEITPNRPDWLGHVGVAREAASFGAGEMIKQSVETHPFKSDPTVASIAIPEAASFYSIRRIAGVKVGPSPEWLRRRLESVSLRSINNIVDVTNFVMFETGQPLHAFDAAKIEGGLVVRFANTREGFTALDGKVYQLTPTDPVIADDRGTQALAGILGGAASGVSLQTTSILLESAVFEPTVIRRSARELGISTDSSYRFERGVNASGAIAASARAAALIMELAGGVAQLELVVAGEVPVPRIVALRGDRVRSLLGIDIDYGDIKALLERIGLKHVSSGWEIPSWRNDLTHEVDLIEEVARLYGVEGIPSRRGGIPSRASVADRAYDFAVDLRRRLSGVGFHEALNGTLTGGRDQEAFAAGGVMRVRNPMGEEHSTLRASLIPGLLDSVARNLRLGAESLRLFEIGKVFQKPSSNKQEEQARLGIAMTGRAAPFDWRGESERSLDLFDLKGVLARIGEFSFKEVPHPRLQLALEILIGGETAGLLGIISPADTRAIMVGGHHHRILVAELDIVFLQEAFGHPFSLDLSKHGSLPRVPPVRRDLALIMDAAIPYGKIEQLVIGAKEPLLTTITPFDVFIDEEGIKVPKGKKSLAIALTFQDSQRTLTAEEVTEALGRIVTRLRKDAGAEIRS